MKRILLFLACIIALASCSKDGNLQDSQHSNASLTYKFDVGEQESVATYEFQISTDGINFVSEHKITASVNMQDTYVTRFDVSKYLGYKKIYSRIKAIDIDGKVLYSKVSANSLN